MRHATEADLDRIDGLLDRLRGLNGLKEPKRGKFQRVSKAFIHFHEDGGDLYADIRHPDGWERRLVTGPDDWDALVAEAESLLS